MKLLLMGVLGVLLGLCSVAFAGVANTTRSAADIPILDTSTVRAANRTANITGSLVSPSPSVSPSKPAVDFSPCPSQCTGHGVDCEKQSDGTHTCTCAAGFAGLTCSVFVGCSQHNHCNGHGACQCAEGGCACVCKEGWLGAACDVPRGSKCPSHCSGRGHCNTQDFTCQCETGFTGADCSSVEPLCTSSCSGVGICNGTRQCECEPGFVGTACEMCVSLCPNGCRHGKCISGKCVCHDSFGGAACDIYMPELDVCGLKATAFCSGHGICVTTKGSARNTSVSCTCQEGFVGQSCSTVNNIGLCETHCSGNGRCDGLKGACVCNRGWDGLDCATPQCPMHHAQLCGGHGLCEGGECVCDDCFSGTDCSFNELEHCPNLCNGHGDCVCSKARHNGTTTTKGVCKCRDGWGGDDCATPLTPDATDAECCPLGCGGNGQCENCVCKCFDTWTGVDCLTSSQAAELAAQDEAMDALPDLLQTSEGVGARPVAVIEELLSVAAPSAAATRAAAVHSMARLWD